MTRLHHLLMERDLLYRCEQCTDDGPFNLLRDGESIHLGDECFRSLLKHPLEGGVSRGMLHSC